MHIRALPAPPVGDSQSSGLWELNWHRYNLSWLIVGTQRKGKMAAKGRLALWAWFPLSWVFCFKKPINAYVFVDSF